MIRENMFGFPIVKQQIDKDSFDKDKIVEDILYNYNLNPNRNNWDDSSEKKPIKSQLHLSYGDDSNEFKQINYSKLIPVYIKKITNFLNEIPFKTPVKFSFTIENYTCIKNNHYMREHLHPECHFTGIHYLKFDKDEHYPTAFTNTHNHANFSESLFPVLLEKLDMTKSENSWIYEAYNMNTHEDDFIITPSIVEHYVPFHSNCKNHRITIAINISIDKD